MGAEDNKMNKPTIYQGLITFKRKLKKRFFSGYKNKQEIQQVLFLSEKPEHYGTFRGKVAFNEIKSKKKRDYYKRVRHSALQDLAEQYE